MSNDELKNSLDKLTEEIKKLDPNDSHSKEKLTQLINDISLKLQEPNNEEHHAKLLPQLKEATIHFEVKHPLITETLQKIIDHLVRLGL